MKFFNFMLFPCSSVAEFYQKFKKRMILHTILEVTKLICLAAIAIFFLVEYLPPFSQTSARISLPEKIEGFLSSVKYDPDSNLQEVLNLANMIRSITDDQLSESKALRYAGLIYHASQKFGVNPLEIIALVMAESEFKEKSVNPKTGDYGLGQINWEYWGKPHGLTPQELLDPSMNIFLTCQVYKFFGKDFGRYHRGDGIKCQVYLMNVKSILSTLHAFVDLNQMNMS